MTLSRTITAIRRTAAGIVLAGLAFAAPAHAQFFWVSPDNSGAPLTGAETDIGITLPGANPLEQQAALVWSLRTALNTAALSCQFEPMLHAVDNYNGALNRHQNEFVSAYTTVEGYFKRTAGAGWQKAFDTYRTRLYNSYATVNAQYTFCQAAGKIGTRAVFAPRGGIVEVAKGTMREFRNSLVFRGDQIRAVYPVTWIAPVLPPLEESCWDRKNQLKKKCAQRYQAALAAPKRWVRL